jgi:hypothetical protein
LHPHNVGGNLRRGMARIVQVLDMIDKYAPKGTLYASMRDLVMFSGSHDSTTA